MENLIRDLKYSFRSLWLKPVFSLTIISILAITIGINTSIFSVVYCVLFEPLPVYKPEQLLVLWENSSEGGISKTSPPNFLDWQSTNQSFEYISAFDTTRFTFTGIGEPQKVTGARVSLNFFQLLGVDVTLGRVFTSDEEKGNKVIVITKGLWQRQFGSDSNIIGKKINTNEDVYTIIGVVREDLDFINWVDPSGAKAVQKIDFFTPLLFSEDELTTRGGRYLNVIARLKPSVTIQQAQKEMVLIASRLENVDVDNNGYTIVIHSLHEQVVGKVKPAILILFVSVCLVLLIACLNIANLLITRAEVRRKEIAIRLAVGSSQFQLVKQFLTESIVISLISSLLGLTLASIIISVIVFSVSEAIPRLSETRINLPVLLFTFAVAVSAGVFFGIFPAIRASRLNLVDSLKESIKSSSQSFSYSYLRNFLVILEVSLSILLAISASLMLQAFSTLLSTNLGFITKNIIVARIVLPSSKYPEKHQKIEFFKKVLQTIKKSKNVSSAGLTTNLPLSGTNMVFPFSISKNIVKDASVQYHSISPYYFRTLGIQILKGRDFTDSDTESSSNVAIINETLAKQFFLNEDPIGKQIKVSYGTLEERQIIGIVKDVRHKNAESIPQPEVYVPYTQEPWSFMTLVISYNINNKNLISELKSSIWTIDKNQPIDSIRTMDDLFSETVARPRFYTQILALFAILAIMLASIGIYGVISNLVISKTHDIGIHMALGAQQSDILFYFLKKGLFLTSIGALLGLLSSIAASRFIGSLLYKTETNSLFVFLFVPMLFIFLCLLATYIPARRAANLEPTIALRHD